MTTDKVDKIERARLLAMFIHLGEKRRNGEDYLVHPERMVSKMQDTYSEDRKRRSATDPNWRATREWISNNGDLTCATWLHDVLENCKPEQRAAVFSTIQSFFPLKVEGLVFCLTHDNSQTYNEYIDSVSQYPDAFKIKCVDMFDNLTDNPTEKQTLKYRNACIYLITKGVEIPKFLKDELEI